MNPKRMKTAIKEGTISTSLGMLAVVFLTVPLTFALPHVDATAPCGEEVNAPCVLDHPGSGMPSVSVIPAIPYDEEEVNCDNCRDAVDSSQVKIGRFCDHGSCDTATIKWYGETKCGAGYGYQVFYVGDNWNDRANVIGSYNDCFTRVWEHAGFQGRHEDCRPSCENVWGPDFELTNQVSSAEWYWQYGRPLHA